MMIGKASSFVFWMQRSQEISFSTILIKFSLLEVIRFVRLPRFVELKIVRSYGYIMSDDGLVDVILERRLLPANFGNF